MEKIKIEDNNYRDTASPDTVRVEAWGIDAFCGDPSGEPFPIIYTERLLNKGSITDTVFVSCDYGDYHSDLSDKMGEVLWHKNHVSYIRSRGHDTYIRIWKKYNIMAIWSRDDNRIEEIKKVINLFKNGNYLSFYLDDDGNESVLPKEDNYMHKGIDFNNLMFYWETYEEDEEGMPSKYICRAPLSELFNGNVNVNVDDSDAKLLHLMTPQEKAQAIQNDEKLKKEREEYAKEGDRAWKAKYGDIDPAKYHLLMYQESKKKNTMKINENDIKKMVNECVKHLLKENFLSFSGKDFENMGLKNPADEFEVNKEELREKCSEFLQSVSNFRAYLNGVESELDDVEDTPGFIYNLSGKHTWNSPDEWNYDDEEMLLKTLNEIESSLYKMENSLKDVIFM